ncbi:MAG: DNA-binding protein [Thaumarchaeota archaeon]|nr:DNA-binding protein [Nitrososphaerota archaeon]
MTTISQLRSGMTRLDTVEGTIDSIGEPRTVNLRAGGQAQVADAILKDDTGQIKLTLWDAQIKMVKSGSKVTIENGYINSFKGENSLNVGKYGKLNIIEF